MAHPQIIFFFKFLICLILILHLKDYYCMPFQSSLLSREESPFLRLLYGFRLTWNTFHWKPFVVFGLTDAGKREVVSEIPSQKQVLGQLPWRLTGRQLIPHDDFPYFSNRFSMKSSNQTLVEVDNEETSR